MTTPSPATERLEQMRELCRAFRANLSPEDQRHFDDLLRRASHNIQLASTVEPLDAMDGLLLSLLVAGFGKIDELERRVAALEAKHEK